MARELDELQKIEQTITKTFHKELWARFQIAIHRYRLIEKGDRIAACISGGKDSMLMAVMLEMYRKYHMEDFELLFLVMDPGYNAENRKKIEDNAARLHLPVTFFSTRIFDIANHSGKSPCYLCARMRRGALYSKARELGCNKIALGHHLNDAIETPLMSMFYSSKIETIIPKSHSENFAGMELIRPLYCIKEADIRKWCSMNNLHFIQCACRFTEAAHIENSGISSKRLEVKNLIAELKKNNPEIEDNIFNALHAVQLETFPGYKLHHEMHSFLDDYDAEDTAEKHSCSQTDVIK